MQKKKELQRKIAKQKIEAVVRSVRISDSDSGVSKAASSAAVAVNRGVHSGHHVVMFVARKAAPASRVQRKRLGPLTHCV